MTCTYNIPDKAVLDFRRVNAHTFRCERCLGSSKIKEIQEKVLSFSLTQDMLSSSILLLNS